jgi:hypothetical protein
MMTRLTVNPYTITDIKHNALSLEQLEKLSTKRIMAYYKKYRHLRHWNVSWCCEFHCEDMSNGRDRARTAVAEAYVDAIKALLDTREHVER